MALLLLRCGLQSELDPSNWAWRKGTPTNLWLPVGLPLKQPKGWGATRLRPTWLYCLRVGPLPLSQPESGFLDRSCCLSHRMQSKIVFKIGMNTQVQVMLGPLPALRKANSSKQKTALVKKAQQAVPQVCFTSTRRPTHILDGSPLNCLFAAERHKPNLGRFGRLSASKLDSALRLELLHLDKIDFVQKTQMILDSGRETQGYI